MNRPDLPFAVLRYFENCSQHYLPPRRVQYVFRLPQPLPSSLLLSRVWRQKRTTRLIVLAIHRPGRPAMQPGAIRCERNKIREQFFHMRFLSRRCDSSGFRPVSLSSEPEALATDRLGPSPVPSLTLPARTVGGITFPVCFRPDAR